MPNRYGYYQGISSGVRGVTDILMKRAEADRSRKEKLEDRGYEQKMWERRLGLSTDADVRKAREVNDIEWGNYAPPADRPYKPGEGPAEGLRRRENEDKTGQMRLNAALRPQSEGDGRDRQREMLWDQYQQLTNEGSWQSDILGERKKGDFNINNLDPAKQKKYRELMNYFGMSADVAGPPAPRRPDSQGTDPAARIKTLTPAQLNQVKERIKADPNLSEAEKSARIAVIDSELKTR